jgi:7-carboxy-7-deazaguanine synthase
LLPSDEIKFVIQNRADFDWAARICETYNLTQRFLVLFSPVYGVLSLKDLAEWILEHRLDVRLQTQLHKNVWGENTRGV